jgi:hypothetical protein
MVAVAVVQGSAEESVELVDVGVVKTAGVLDGGSRRVRDVVHESEDAPLAVLAMRTAAWSSGPSVSAGSRSSSERVTDEGRDQRAGRPHVTRVQVGYEYGIQGAGVREQQTLAPLDPQQVGVPVLLTWWCMSATALQSRPSMRVVQRKITARSRTA